MKNLSYDRPEHGAAAQFLSFALCQLPAILYVSYNDIPAVVDEETGIKDQDQVTTYVIKNYRTQARYQGAITPRKVSYAHKNDTGIVTIIVDHGETWSSNVGYEDENGQWWIADAYKHGAYTEVAPVSGGKGPYTYTWYLSSTKDGNDVRAELVEGVNCLGQGTDHILVWSDQVGKGQTDPYFLGVLFCKVTDKMGRVAKSCCWVHVYTDVIYHTYRMLHTLNENHSWWGDENNNSPNDRWTTNNEGILAYFPPAT